MEDNGGIHAEFVKLVRGDHGAQAETQNNGGEHAKVEKVIFHPIKTLIKTINSLV